MIIIRSDRTVYIPESDRHIGFENDNLVEKRLFKICDSELFDFSFKLDIKNTLDIVDLALYETTGNSRIFSWDVTSSVIGKGGVITAQLRAFDETGERVWHSALFEFVAEPSVNAEKQSDSERILTEFEQLEIRVQNAVNGIEDSALASEQFAKDSARSCIDAQTAAENAELSAEKILKTEADFKIMTGGYEGISSEAKSHYDNMQNPHNVTAEQVGAYTKSEADRLLENKAEKDHTHAEASYTYDIVDVDLTTCTTIIRDIGAEDPAIDSPLDISSESISGCGEVRIDVSGYVELEVISTSSLYEGSSTDYITINEVTTYFTADNHTLTFSGEITSAITAFVDLSNLEFSKFKNKPGTPTGSSVGMMPEGSLMQIHNIDTKLGDISTALDSILAIQKELWGEAE